MSRQEVLEAAMKCVCGDRDKQYGSPEDSFAAIAALWESYIATRCVAGEGVTLFITPTDVAAMMVLFKVGRIATGTSKDDNWIDIAGYAACGAEVSE